MTSTPGEEPVLTPREHRRLADVLLKARRECRAVRPFTASYPELTLIDAKLIRDAVVSKCAARGDTVIGAELHATLGHGMPEESFGIVTSGMLMRGDEVELEGLIRPHLEAKLALVLDVCEDLDEDSASVIQVLPSLEVVDSRFDPAHPSVLDDVADDFGSSLLFLGPGLSPSEIRFDRLVVSMDSAGSVASPFDGWYRFLTGNIRDHSRRVRAGDLLLSPTLATSPELTPGRAVACDFGELGELRLIPR